MPGFDEQTEGLIGRLYDAAAGLEGWRDVLASIADLLGGSAAVISTIRARQTCCCGLLRSETTPSSRFRSPGRSRTSTLSLMRPDSQVRASMGIINADQPTSVVVLKSVTKPARPCPRPGIAGRSA